MNAICFDVETTGKPINYKAPMTLVDNWPRISQIAWKKVNLETGETLNEYQSIITPDGWTIPTVEELKAKGEKNPHFFEENGMSTERCLAEGKPIAEVLDHLIEDMNDSVFLVAHNINFDRNVVGAEMIRLNKSSVNRLQLICTMESSTRFCKLPGAYGKYKWPKLEELHRKLFNEDFDGAHDALADVSATVRCLLQLLKLGVINLNHKPMERPKIK